MNQEQKQSHTPAKRSALSMVGKVLLWPFVFAWHVLYRNWLSYVFGQVLRDDRRVYSIKFIWYGDSIYLHPMTWGSVVLFFVAKSGVVDAGWPLLIWFILLAICFLTVIYNFDILKAGVLLICVVAVFGMAYISSREWEWNPLSWVSGYVSNLHVTVSDGFYIAAAWVFVLLISAEVVWAWMFNRVELDESYCYEHRFLQGTSREPIFARGLKRETKDLLELLILGAGDIVHRTKNGFKRYKNVPGALLGLGKAIDSMLDYRGTAEWKNTRSRDDDAEQVMVNDAFPEMHDDDGIHDDGDMGDGDDAGDMDHAL